MKCHVRLARLHPNRSKDGSDVPAPARASIMPLPRGMTMDQDRTNLETYLTRFIGLPTRNIDWIDDFIPHVAGRSDRGLRRASNEDRLMRLPEHRLVAVADGIGGCRGGGRASTLAI